MDEGFKKAAGFEDVAVELFSGEMEGEGGRGLEDEGEGEGVGGSAGAEHLAVEKQSMFVLPILRELSQLRVPFGPARGGGGGGFSGLRKTRCLQT